MTRSETAPWNFHHIRDTTTETQMAGKQRSTSDPNRVGDSGVTREDIITRASRLRSYGKKTRKSNKEQFKSASSGLCKANSFARDAFLSHINRNTNMDIRHIEGNLASRVSMLCYFIHGIHSCERAIMEGLYPQAGALLRQEHELIGATEKLKQSSTVKKIKPNPRIGILENQGLVYKQLSNLVHVGRPRWLAEKVTVEIEGKPGPSLAPVLDLELSQSLLVTHIRYVIMMAALAHEIGNELGYGGLSQEEWSQLDQVVRILREEGFVVNPQNQDS